MRTDKFGHVIYNESDLMELVYQDRLDLVQNVYVENYIKVPDLNLKYIDNSIYEIDLELFDIVCQQEWLIPKEYKEFDITTWLFNQIPPWDEANDRLFEELREFEKRNMTMLLRWLKYLVDTARANNVVWGVGRGSSVASYVLYLIGVHKIDPIKYNLDWRDFLR